MLTPRSAADSQEVDHAMSRAMSNFFTSNSEEMLLKDAKAVKNTVIGNKRKKVCFINQGIVDKLVALLRDPNQADSVKAESAIILGSLTRGPDSHVARIVSAGAMETLIQNLNRPCGKVLEACLCCLRSLVLSPACPKDFIYADPNIVPHLLNLVTLSSDLVKICVSTILANCCQNDSQQNYLHSKHTVELLLPLLCSENIKIHLPILQFYGKLCYQNRIVSTQMLLASYNGTSLQDWILKQLARSHPLSVRLQAVKCLTYMHRAGAIPAHDPSITLKVIPTLVTLCKSESTHERVEAAETIAYLTEADVELQKKASITDQSINILARFFKFAEGCKDNDKENLQQSALRAFASLGANDEEIRKKIIESDHLMEHVIVGLSSSSVNLQLAAARCIHSLSRSVQQLRTSFQDHAVWKPLMEILRQEKSEELMCAVSSTLCNLLLEFSPSKEPILELGAIKLLVDLTYNEHLALRLNAVWALMNMAFKADQSVKVQILSSLGTQQLFCLLGDSYTDVVMKTLGLLRNLLSHKPHIDHIMCHDGEKVIQAVVMILEGDHNVEIKEQTLCLLANVADGDSSKEYIMNNDDILKKIIDYMKHSHIQLQVAAAFCVSNLVWNEEVGARERQQKLKSLGALKILEQLLGSADATLFEKAKAALQQFS